MISSIGEMEKLDDYIMISTIQEGNEYFVSRAKRESDNKSVIIKTINPYLSNEDASAKLLNEHTILNEVSSVYVPQIIDFFDKGKEKILIMEDAGGEPLNNIVAPNYPSFFTCVKIAYHLSLAIHDIHTEGIIHGCISPRNIYWNEKNESIFVLNFSVANMVCQDKSASITIPVHQDQLPYASPETMGTTSIKVDNRSDLYSLGATLYELLGKRVPFICEDRREYLHAHVAKVPKPLHVLDPTIPPKVSEIISKLLSKSPKDRYASGLGLSYDFKKVIEADYKKENINDIILGQLDYSDRLKTPTKLIGRQEELSALERSIAQAIKGTKNLVVISGYSGVGKTSLCRKLELQVDSNLIRFISGKFDLVRGDIPYTGLIEAFNQIVDSQLTESNDYLEKWRLKIRKKLGNNSKLLTDLIPKLKLIVGRDSAAIALAPEESHLRFLYVLKEYLKLLVNYDKPIALFLDDVQWADDASLEILDAIISEKSLANLVIILAYRSNEVGYGSDLYEKIKIIQEHAVECTSISLGNLNKEEFTNYLSETLNTNSIELTELSASLLEKTGGNPFFTSQLLKDLVRKEIIKFEDKRGRWRWENNRLSRVEVTANIVDYMLESIETLPMGSQRVIGNAAFLGKKIQYQDAFFCASKRSRRSASGY